MFFIDTAIMSVLNKQGVCVRGNVDAIALSYPPRVRVRATVKLSAAFFNDKSSITIGGGGGYESAIVPKPLHS